MVHRDHLISLGLKLQTVRRLRWLDRRRRAERLEIEERYQEQVGEAEEELRAAVTQQNRDILDLANRRAADATAAASSASAWYRSWTFGFILGFVVSGALVALAAYVGASI